MQASFRIMALVLVSAAAVASAQSLAQSRITRQSSADGSRQLICTVDVDTGSLVKANGRRTCRRVQRDRVEQTEHKAADQAPEARASSD